MEDITAVPDTEDHGVMDTEDLGVLMADPGDHMFLIVHGGLFKYLLVASSVRGNRRNKDILHSFLTQTCFVQQNILSFQNKQLQSHTNILFFAAIEIYSLYNTI